MSMARDRVKILLVIVALAAVVLTVPHTTSFIILLATRALAFSILVMSLDLLLGFTGLASLGQAAFLLAALTSVYTELVPIALALVL